MFSSKPYNTMKSRVLYHLCISASAELNKASESIAAAFKVFDKEKDNKIETMDAIIKEYRNGLEDILANFKFVDEVKNMVKGNVLYVVIQEFNSKKADMSPDKITSMDMGYIFEELIRKFSESYNEEAGAHFTSRDIIYLMTELLISPEQDEIKEI